MYMRLFSIHDLLDMAWLAVTTAWKLKGVIAEEALRLVFLPFHELSITSCIVSIGWIVFFWKNKSWILSGLSHIFHTVDWFMGLFRRAQG